MLTPSQRRVLTLLVKRQVILTSDLWRHKRTWKMLDDMTKHKLAVYAPSPIDYRAGRFMPTIGAITIVRSAAVERATS